MKKVQKFLKTLSSPIKFLGGCICFALSVWIPYRCVDPEEARYFNNFDYAVVQYSAILDNVSIFIFIFLIYRLVYKQRIGASIQIRKAIHIFWITAFLQLLLLITCRQIDSFLSSAYHLELVKDNPYACGKLPISILAALHYWTN